MTHGSLFAGIGGFDLGFQRAGIETVWQVEIDPFCRRVLERRFPSAKRFINIRECGTANLQRVDITSGGFPCQDISYAGLGAGIDGERSGLWSEYFRVISELRPKIAVVENVAALLGRGIERVLGDLASIGYDAEWRIISARDIGAPHLRERVWIISYPSQGRRGQARRLRRNKPTQRLRGSGKENISTNFGEERVQRFFTEAIPRFKAFSWCQDVRRVEDLRGRCDIPKPIFRGTRDGIPDWVDRVSGLGNAIVPQIAEWIGQRIIAAEKLTSYSTDK
jgi:DNA (cytosine-5)-methyltransferase 1